MPVDGEERDYATAPCGHLSRNGSCLQMGYRSRSYILSAVGGEIVNLQFRSLRYNSKPELPNPIFIALVDRAYPWQRLLDKQ
ncbi:MAG TPA: hypothetical protein EYP91_17725 [Gammaproteobacteria bacterium]|nr:hypothetical protein [Gammaproteobacteria bacterium]